MAVFPNANVLAAAGLPQIHAIIQRTKALNVLEKNTVFYDLMMGDNVPKQSGRRIQWYRPLNFTDPASVSVSDGSTPGTGLTYNAAIIQCTLQNYTDYVLLSRQVTDVSPTPDLEDATARLTYRASLINEYVFRQAIDNESSGMSISALSGDFPSARDAHNIRVKLANKNVTRGAGSHGKQFPIVMSPLHSYDFFNDPTAGGYMDVVKWNTPIAQSTPLLEYPDRGQVVATIRGCDIIESTTVTVRAGAGTNGANLYRMYALGYEAFGRVNLGGNSKRFQINSRVIPVGSELADPAGETGAYASFNGWVAATVLDGNPTIGGDYRGYVIDAPSAVG